MAKATEVGVPPTVYVAVFAGVACTEPVTSSKPGGRKSMTCGLRVWVWSEKSTRRAKQARSPARNALSTSGRSVLSR